MHIAVGSTNPIKFSATQTVLGALYPAATFTTHTVPSDVAAQPWGDEETRRGAYNRARATLQQSGARLAVGLEGGVLKTEFGLFTCAWCVIINADGRVGVGGSSCTQLPPEVETMLVQGIELGPAMDALSGQTNTKHNAGAIGILTNGLLTRQTAYEVIIKMALSPFLHPEWYASEDALRHDDPSV